MKICFKIVLLLFCAGCIIACGNGKDYDQREYFLSQPRDPKLLGWWKHPYDSIHKIQTFWNFQQDATITVLSYMDGSDIDDYAPYYWYTEKKDENILHIFVESGLPEYLEYHSYYKIVNDSIWCSENIHSTELYFWGERCSTPEE
ncbi:MAG: hypothetical protein LBS43_11295 [Prevotellaceae bacterium]|jgi:hypothetical protein|nr:hypothetical protein [Prevotellaceae bacterium]